jgi:hypothetical protein
MNISCTEFHSYSTKGIENNGKTAFYFLRGYFTRHFYRISPVFHTSPLQNSHCISHVTSTELSLYFTRHLYRISAVFHTSPLQKFLCISHVTSTEFLLYSHVTSKEFPLYFTHHLYRIFPVFHTLLLQNFPQVLEKYKKISINLFTPLNIKYVCH